MILSMTGYGRVIKSFQSKSIIVEVKSLNSKYLDLKIRIPQGYRNKEMDVRKLVSGFALRGKIDMTIEIKFDDATEEMVFNKNLFKAYYSELQGLSQEINIKSNDDFTQAIMRLPNIVAASDELANEAEWDAVRSAMKEALETMIAFRKTEGQSLNDDFMIRVNSIKELLAKVEPFEGPRIEKLRTRFLNNLTELQLNSEVDPNRLEQEIIYYMEKMDITEEKVRLKQHCDYFITQLNDTKTTMKGRKLNFISQEMGREINTLGAKANSADIQKLVVMMKDELEKIKEQTANVL